MLQLRNAHVDIIYNVPIVQMELPSGQSLAHDGEMLGAVVGFSDVDGTGVSLWAIVARYMLQSIS